MENKQYTQNSQEWLDMRKAHIGASEISVIMGINPWKSAYELFLEKTGKKEAPEPNYFMLMGKAKESEARAAYISKTGNIVMPSVTFYKEWPIALASLDGITEDEELIVEIKCPTEKTYEAAKSLEVPKHYMAQIQWQMMCSGAKKCDYFVYLSEGKNVQVTVLEDKPYQQEMLLKAKGFWECVETDVTPEITQKDYVIIDDAEFLRLAKLYKEATMLVEKATKTQKDLKKMILDFTDDGNAEGGGLKIRRSEGKKTIQWKLLAESLDVKEELIERFTKTGSTIWTITIDK